MTGRQSEFRAALLDAAHPLPEGLTDGQGRPASGRFSVYRNNVVVSLSAALETGFPLVRKLLGREAFARLAAVYVRAYPPSSPVMMHYGAELPDFLARFGPLRHIGYLADCARLDLAMRRSYHAQDVQPADPGIFTDTDAVLKKCFALAPAVEILRSDWPLFDIWRFNMVAGAEKPRAVAQDVMVGRHEFEPKPHVLPPGGAVWFDLLAQGVPLGPASDQAIAIVPAFELEGLLTLALTTGALIDHSEKETM